MMKIILIFLFHSLLINCKASPLPSINKPVNVSDVVFVNLGTYRGFTADGSEYQKSYYLSRIIHDVWNGAKSFCKSFNLELVTLETLAEARAFLSLADRNPYFKIYNDANFYIDGMTSTLKSTSGWYWTESGNKFSFPIPWLPGQPDNSNGKEYCFGFRRTNANQNFGYADFVCDSQTFTPLFACQRIDLFIPVMITD